MKKAASFLSFVQGTLFGMIFCRFFMLLMDGMGWKTVSTATLLVTHLRLDVAVELLLMSTLEQVCAFKHSQFGQSCIVSMLVLEWCE